MMDRMVSPKPGGHYRLSLKVEGQCVETPFNTPAINDLGHLYTDSWVLEVGYIQH